MFHTSNESFLNSASTVAESPAEQSRMLLDHYLKLGDGAKELFGIQLIAQITAAEAVCKRTVH